MMRIKLKRFGEVETVDETNDFGLDLVKKQIVGLRHGTSAFDNHNNIFLSKQLH